MLSSKGLEGSSNNKSFIDPVSLRALCPFPPPVFVPVVVWLIIMVCLAGGLRMNLIVNEQLAVMCRASRGRVELVWSSARHLTHVNSSNESGLFLGGLFFISGVRGRRPRLAGWLSGRQLKRRAEEWGERRVYKSRGGRGKTFGG